MLPLLGLFAYMKPALFGQIFQGNEHYEKLLVFINDLLTFRSKDIFVEEVTGRDEETCEPVEALSVAERIFISSMKFATLNLFADGTDGSWSAKLVDIIRLWMSPRCEDFVKS